MKKYKRRSKVITFILSALVLIAQAQGHTFAEACEFWYLNNVPRKEFEKYFRVTNGKPSYWVNLYDNEEDAKKAFG